MILDYHLPQLGKISTTLFPFAEETYNLLNNYGHIRRLRVINQLGVIKNIFEGAHHSRWEYVMLQLSIIHKLSILTDEKNAKVASGLGLGSTNIDFFGHKPSGAEILQIWVLLSNSGHLPGTFATMRGLLRVCQKDKNFRENIYEGLPKDKDIRKYFKEVVKKEKVYSFHKTLLYFHLERYRRYKSSIPNFIDFLITIMSFYDFDASRNKEKQRNLRHLFRKIRQISYLYLDSLYGPVPIDFNIAAILSDLPSYIPNLFKTNDSHIIRTLDSFDDLLSVSIYHSAKAMRDFGYHSRHVESLLGEENLNRKIKLQRFFLKEYEKLKPLRQEWKNALNLNLLFAFPSSLAMAPFKRNMTMKIEKEWNERYGCKTCNLTIQPGSSSRHMLINLSFPPTMSIKHNLKVISKFASNISDANAMIKNDEQIKAWRIYPRRIDQFFQKPYQDLFLTLLSYITKSDLSFEFKRNIDARGKVAMCKGAKRSFHCIKKVIMRTNEKNPRYHELVTFQEAVDDSGFRANVLLSLVPVVISDVHGKPLTDLDGFGFIFKSDRVDIFIVEAKDKMRGGKAAAKKQLKKTFKKLGFKTSIEPVIKEIGGGVYSHLPINGKRQE